MAFTLEDINGITDATFTPELEAALMPKIEARATTYLAGKGFMVKPKTEYDTEFATEINRREKAFADSESPKFYGAMDRMLAAAGLPKPDGMKTRVWVDQLATENKLPFTAEQQAKIEKALKGDAGNGTPATVQALIDAQKVEFDTYKKAVEDGKKNELSKAVGRFVSSSLKTAPVPIDASIKDEAAKNTAKNAAVSDITAVFNTLYEGGEDEAGVLFFKKKGTDAPLMNTATGEPMTPLEIIRANHKIYLAPEGHQQQGGGTGKAPANYSGAPGNADAKKADAYKAAHEAGHRMFSPEWKKFIAEKTK